MPTVLMFVLPPVCLRPVVDKEIKRGIQKIYLQNDEFSNSFTRGAGGLTCLGGTSGCLWDIIWEELASMSREGNSGVIGVLLSLKWTALLRKQSNPFKDKNVTYM
jgi:hypothetical protein